MTVIEWQWSHEEPHIVSCLRLNNGTNELVEVKVLRSELPGIRGQITYQNLEIEVEWRYVAVAVPEDLLIVGPRIPTP